MRQPRIIHLMGHDWRVEFVPPEKLAAIIKENADIDAVDCCYAAFWCAQRRAIWLDGTLPAAIMMESVLHEATEIVAHELGFAHISPADDDGHREIGLLCRFLAALLLENKWLAEWPAEIYEEAHGQTPE